MKNWKLIVIIAAGVVAAAGIITLIVLNWAKIADFFVKTKDTVSEKAAGFKSKYTEDELADFADV